MLLFCCIAATAMPFAPRARVFHAESTQNRASETPSTGVDLEVITGNTAAIFRSGITPIRALRDLTQQTLRSTLKLYDPDANEAKPWRVQWKEGGEKMGTRKGRDDVRVKAGAPSRHELHGVTPN